MIGGRAWQVIAFHTARYCNIEKSHEAASSISVTANLTVSDVRLVPPGAD